MHRLLRAVRRAGAAAVLGGALALALGAGSADAQQCTGDCDGSGDVVVSELIRCVNIALGNQPLANCEACDDNGDGMVVINELVVAVNRALNGCTPVVGTPTATPPTTGTPCPLDPGRYTITQGEGGTLRVASFAAFPFPAGGTLVQEVSPAFEPECIHDVVVPFPGGFNAPTFCIPALGFTTSVTQTACGIGQIDSNGGSDFTVVELGDTSDTNGPCNLPQAGTCPAAGGPGGDSDIRVQITVGDGTPDTCESGGTGNALVVVPVFTRTWREVNEGDLCPGESFDDGDQLIVEFPQILDFTTDSNSARFEDLDGDGCFRSGVGPPGGLPQQPGVCMDLDARTVTTVASGVLGSSGAPTFDLAFTTRLPNTFQDPEPLTGATCEPPPVINFVGTADRCIDAD